MEFLDSGCDMKRGIVDDDTFERRIEEKSFSLYQPLGSRGYLIVMESFNKLFCQEE